MMLLLLLAVRMGLTGAPEEPVGEASGVSECSEDDDEVGAAEASVQACLTVR